MACKGELEGVGRGAALMEMSVGMGCQPLG